MSFERAPRGGCPVQTGPPVPASSTPTRVRDPRPDLTAASGVPFGRVIQDQAARARLRIAAPGSPRRSSPPPNFRDRLPPRSWGWLELPFEQNVRRVRDDGRRVLLRGRPSRPASAGFPAAFPPDARGPRRQHWVHVAPHPLTARSRRQMQLPAGGDRVARPRPDPRRAARGAVVLRLSGCSSTRTPGFGRVVSHSAATRARSTCAGIPATGLAIIALSATAPTSPMHSWPSWCSGRCSPARRRTRSPWRLSPADGRLGRPPPRPSRPPRRGGWRAVAADPGGCRRGQPAAQGLDDAAADALFTENVAPRPP